MNRAALRLTLLSLALSGCTNMIGVTRDVDAALATNIRTADDRLARLSANDTGPKPLLYTTVMPGAWMGAAKLPPRAVSRLPLAFKDDVTLKFPDRASMSVVAERITKVTGIAVKLNPDIFISSSVLAPKPAPGATATSPAAAPVPTFPGSVSQTQSSNVSADYAVDIGLAYSGKLEGILDAIAAKLGINWEYKNGTIVFSRLVTQTFTMKSTPGTSELKSSVGKSGTGAMGTGSTFTSDSVIKMGSAFSVWENLRESITSMLTGIGKVAVTEATGTITVTDTREVVEQVGTMLEQINKSLSRQVAFRVEVLSVRTDESADYGVNWDAVFSKISAANPNLKFTLGSPSSLTSSDAAKIGITASTLSGTSGSTGTQSTSQAMLAALAGVGKASVVTTASALTLNRQPVPVAITEQVSYVQSIAVQASQSTGGTNNNNSPTLMEVTPGVVTTGFILNLLPSIAEDSSVTLQVSIDMSSLKRLDTFGQGSMAVQSPSVSAMQFMQRVSMKNGETLVLSGFERTSGQYDRRTMSQDADLLLGGSVKGTKTRESIVIMITPVVSSGV
jgi:type IVB pilus formation R64 PilN family outer membrane protein